MPRDKKPPAFQFYPADFLSDENVVLMSSAARGAYIMLLCHCWLQGSLPNDPDRLQRLAGIVMSDWGEIWQMVEPCFRNNGNSRLYHPRLRAERSKQRAYSEERSRSGRKGAANRWSKGDSSANSSAKKEPMAKNGSSSSSSTSTSTSVNNPPVVPPADTDIEAHFSRLWKLWPRKAHELPAKRAYLFAIDSGCPQIDELEKIVTAWAQSPGWRKDSGKYVPRLDKWLDGQRWTEPLPDTTDSEDEGWYVVAK